MAGLLLAALGSTQLRVATWNVSNYTGGRESDLNTAIFSSFQGRSMRPDIIVTQEFTSQAAQNSFLAMLNAGPFGPVWQAAPFTNGPDTDSAFFYRSDRINLVSSQIVINGGNSPLPPRDVKRYDVTLQGYSIIAPKIAIYSCHMKAGTSTTDLSRRLTEANAIRNNITGLTGFDGVMVVGDFNMQSSSEDAFVKLTGSEANNAGRLFDPIATPGDWDDDVAFKFVHTQDPSGSAGMDSRYDFILLNEKLTNGSGFDYIGHPTTPYSTITWNDPAHSYRAWGNDGTSFNNTLTIAGNAMVGSAIAQALVNASTTNGGHLPVFLDVRVPAEIGINTSAVDFGTVVQGSAQSRNVNIFNQTDTVRWLSGIADLAYQLSANGAFSAPSGTFLDPAGGGSNSHAISLDTTQTGVKTGTLTVTTSDDPPHQRTISLAAQVVPDQLHPSTFAVEMGRTVSGVLSNVFGSDDVRLTLGNNTRERTTDPIRARFESTSPVPSVSTMTIKVESLSLSGLIQYVDLYNFTTGAYVPLGSRPLTTTDGLHTIAVSQPNSYIQAGTGQIRMRIRWRKTTTAGPIAPVTAAIDSIGIELR